LARAEVLKTVVRRTREVHSGVTSDFGLPPRFWKCCSARFFPSVTGQLVLPRAKAATRQSRAFSIVGPFSWNGLPLEIRLLPKNNESAFCTEAKARGFGG